MRYSYYHVRRIIFLFVCITTALYATAQTAKITGQVKDQNGQGLAGASVQIEGTNIGTVTDNNGFYSLNTNPGKHTLIVSYVGFATQRIEVNLSSNGSSANDAVLLSTGNLS